MWSSTTQSISRATKTTCSTFLLAFVLFAPVAQAQSSHEGVVGQKKNILLSLGENLSGPCGAFKITREVAADPIVRAEGWGLVHSTGNGCQIGGETYRADTLMQPNGFTVDILIRSESDNGDTSNNNAFNIPTWGQTGNQDPANWRQPLPSAIQSVPVPNPFPQPTPTPTPVPVPAPVVITQSVDLSSVNLRLDALKARVEELYNNLYNQGERSYTDLAARDVAIQDQIRKHDEDPTWIRKFFTNSNTWTAIITALGALAAHQATQ